MTRWIGVLIVYAIAITILAAPAVRGIGYEIYFEDFEADDGGFIGTRDWEWGDYSWIGGNCYSAETYPPPGAYSGSRMWGTVLNDCHNNLGNNQGYDTCDNTNTADDSILSFTVDLTGYPDAALTFYEWWDSFLEWDWAEIYVNGDVVFQHCGTSYVPPDSWQLQMIDLTPYSGAPVTIAFHYMASTVVNKAGWYIDDVRISTSVEPPTPTPSSTPTPDCVNNGDVDGNGILTAGDAQLAFLIVLGTHIPTYEEECAADCNGDGIVTAGDAQLIFMTVLGSGTCMDPL